MICFQEKMMKELQANFLDLEELCEKVCRLLRTLFPAIDIPKHSYAPQPQTVEMLMMQVMDIVNDNKQGQAKSQSACSNPMVHLCKEPFQNLQNLRRKVCEFLVAVLPELVLPPSFDQTGRDVERLVDFVIDSNKT